MSLNKFYLQLLKIIKNMIFLFIIFYLNKKKNNNLFYLRLNILTIINILYQICIKNIYFFFNKYNFYL